MNFLDRLTAIFGAEAVLADEPLSAHTTFRIGGPADFFVTPADEHDLAKGISLCKAEGIQYFILGNGSNLLVGDGGFRGVIFCICKTMCEEEYKEEGDTLIATAGAGVMLSKFARTVAGMGYEGFEYATGIPGTLGGGVTMNAGAYGGEIKDSFLWADVLTEDGQVKRLSAEDFRFDYRHSLVMEENLIVLRASFAFKKGDGAAIAAKVAELSSARREKQPLEYPSAGSTFKRPEGYFAGKLIQDCNLKGYTVGGAQVSEKHSGFVINIGGASAADVLQLIKDVQKTVRDTFNIELEPEVRMLGEF